MHIINLTINGQERILGSESFARWLISLALAALALALEIALVLALVLGS